MPNFDWLGRLAKFKQTPQRRRPVKTASKVKPTPSTDHAPMLSSVASMPKTLPAVGLASCVAQLVDFALKILLKDHEVYQSLAGADIENSLVLRSITHELYRLAEKVDALKLKRLGAEKKGGKLDDAVQQLLKLSETAKEVVFPLIDALSQGQAKFSSESPLVTVREGLLTALNKGQITNFRKKLQLVRKELDAALLRAIRAYIDQSSQKGLPTINVEDSQAHYLEQWQDDAVRSIKTNDWKAKNKKHVEEFSRLVDLLILSENEAYFRDEIFAQLHFPEQDDRFYSISKPDDESFKWIFDSRRQNEEVTGFLNWLGDTSGQNIFWMTGKPGCGKSTLMKHLFRNEELFPYLEKWSGHAPGILTGFFCWNCGTDLQKTTVGLLRSLLYEALQDMIYGPLEQDPNMVQWLFTDRWEQFSSYGGGLHSFDLSELRIAFDLLLSDSLKKFLFMIDGLDELDEDLPEALGVLVTASKRENVKICMSSRTSLACQSAFKDRPTMQLDKWTKNGILDYVLYAFDQNDTMFNIPAEQSDGTEERAIIHTFVEKASGVFLWASLAIEFLIQSTSETDDVSTIRRRVNALPTGLENLLTHIFDSLDAEHFRQASRLFRLVDAHGYPALLPLCSAVDPDTRSGLEAATRPLTTSEVLTRTERMRNVLVFKCKNLLSIFEAVPTDAKRSSVEVADPLHYKVNYAHRCIRDHIRTYDMRSRIAKATGYEAFLEDEHWANAHLWSLKTLQVRDGKLRIWDTLADCIEHALRLERFDNRVRLTYLDEVNATLAAHLLNPATPVAIMDLPPGATVQSFGDIAVWLNLTNYLTIKARSADKKDLRHALEYAKDVRKRLAVGGEDRFIGGRSKLRGSYERVDHDLAALLEYHTRSMKLGSPRITKDMPEWV